MLYICFACCSSDHICCKTFRYVIYSLKLFEIKLSSCITFLLCSGIPALDFIICQWWHTNAFYWGSMFVSICNLILVAFERQVLLILGVPLRDDKKIQCVQCHLVSIYLSDLFVFVHNELTNKRITICIICMYFGSVAANWGTPIIGKIPLYNNNYILWFQTDIFPSVSAKSATF